MESKQNKLYNNGKHSDHPIVAEMIRLDNEVYQIHKEK